MSSFQSDPSIIPMQEEDILQRCMRVIASTPELPPPCSLPVMPANSGAPVLYPAPSISTIIPSCTPIFMMPPMVTHPSVPAVMPGLNETSRPPKPVKKPKSKSSAPTCDICGREFLSDRNLRVHTDEIHKGGRGKFTCADCGLVFTRIRSLERHQNSIHLKDRPLCKICDKFVVNYDRHYRRFHCKSISIQTDNNTD
ncbi:hypothetical protein TCAL_14544 [Tigriopus californicus]|uniref:C2H2-type domain-containing protein n=1 Tax=Tigriopus californicus TaxID=6832 RepID=A0A553PAL1_TIGCA|nr:endothelial zinc finger protein induced by tumor necrosis factor alpha-like [Tigriopus californicus]TRY74721.1 hypothetical protein TCAL_14544 [Tigriopus californicus]